MKLLNLYQPFFDLHNWETVLTSANDWLLILTLVLMECLLSVDNAVVLAAQTQSLPDKKQQRKSLIYGLWGAYLFRFIVIGIGTYLIHWWEIKALGSIYLFYLAVSFFWKQHHPTTSKTPEHKSKQAQARKHVLSLFWRVVISIELMDIVFSIDSVLAALALSGNPVIVLLGGMIGILAMRGVAEIIIKLMQIIPELQYMAYVLIMLISFKLFLALPIIDYEVPNNIFAIIILVIIAGTIIYHFLRPKKTMYSQNKHA